MKINKPFTDKEMINLVEDQLEMVTSRHGFKYHSAEEMLGVLTEEYHEVIEAIRAGKGHVSTAVLSELIDVATVCIRGARSYMHGEGVVKDSLTTNEGVH